MIASKFDADCVVDRGFECPVGEFEGAELGAVGAESVGGGAPCGRLVGCCRFGAEWMDWIVDVVLGPVVLDEACGVAPDARAVVVARRCSERVEVGRWVGGDCVDEAVESEGDSGLEAVELSELGFVRVLVVGSLAAYGGLECVLDVVEAVGGVGELAFGDESLGEAFAAVTETGPQAVELFACSGLLRDEFVTCAGEGFDVGGAVGWHRVTYPAEVRTLGVQGA